MCSTDADLCRGCDLDPRPANCPHPGDDGCLVQCVGQWAVDKHDYIGRYVDATRAVRAKFLTPAKNRPAGGAAFIDLFAGPGSARLRDGPNIGTVVDGSPLLAARHDAAPFSKLIFCDLAPDNVAALGARIDTLGSLARTAILVGDCNELVEDIVPHVPTYGLNIALIDPFGLRPLFFETIAALAAIRRMDLLIHFPTGDIKRNFHQNAEYITQFLGTDGWQKRVPDPQGVVSLIEVLREQLGAFGYEQDNVRSLPIKNSRGVVLYHLVYATKEPLGNKIWQSIAQVDAHGQRSFCLD